MQAIEQKVIEIVKAVFDAEDLTGETTFEQLSADSLHMVELAMHLEDEFDITIEDEACENLDNVQGFIDLVVNLKVA